jgi:transcription elongation factor GreB
MSKAFTKEDAGGPDGPDGPDDDDPELDAVDRSKKRYITPGGYKRLEAELLDIVKVKRPKITQEVSDAAALGDRSENAEYIYGKRKLRELDRRIRYLTKLLDRLTVVHPAPRQEGTAYFGATVTLEDEEGDEVTYRIVGPDETDVKAGHISLESPVARALLGKREGDELTVEKPRGRADYTVLRISYE